MTEIEWFKSSDVVVPAIIFEQMLTERGYSSQEDLYDPSKVKAGE